MCQRRGPFGLPETTLHGERCQSRYQRQQGRCGPFMYTVQDSYPKVAVGKSGEAHTSLPLCIASDLTEHLLRLQHIRFQTDQGQIKGHVNTAQGRAVRVTPHAKLTTTIRSVVTVGKEDLTGAEATRAGLILNAFKGSDSLFSSPFVRKVFFPNYPLHTLNWPELPTTQPKISFAYRELNKSQQKAVEKCLSNKEADRHVVIVVSPFCSFYPLPYLTMGVRGRQGPGRPLSSRPPFRARSPSTHRIRSGSSHNRTLPSRTSRRNWLIPVFWTSSSSYQRISITIGKPLRL